MKSEPMGRKIDRLLAAGMAAKSIAAAVGCRIQYVYTIKSIGGYDAHARYCLEYQRARKGRARHGSDEHLAKLRSKADIARNTAVIADVDAGLSYAETARKNGLASRNVVAGIMNRRAEARA